jgi:hypothetical protein
MSSYIVVSAVSDALRHILWEAFDQDAVVRPLVGSEAAIVFSNPTETASNTSNRLSLWLYQITENEFVKNQPVQRANGANTAKSPPLALNLFYLLTPFASSNAGNEKADHLLIGKAMQVMYDHAILLLRDTVEDVAEELRIVFCRLTLEELTRIWEALQQPYRLSICYQVRVTRIESRRELPQARVIERGADFSPLPGSGTG